MDSKIDSGGCQYQWKPKLTLANCLDCSTISRSFLSHADLKLAKYSQVIRGTFTSTFDFRRFPADEQVCQPRAQR
eukprot:scaffold347_cov380-Prasinococcus_capsulatus_cf.AAC.18